MISIRKTSSGIRQNSYRPPPPPCQLVGGGGPCTATPPHLSNCGARYPCAFDACTDLPCHKARDKGDVKTFSALSMSIAVELSYCRPPIIPKSRRGLERGRCDLLSQCGRFHEVADEFDSVPGDALTSKAARGLGYFMDRVAEAVVWRAEIQL